MAALENMSVNSSKKPSFLIRDILENDFCDRNNCQQLSRYDKPYTFTLPWSHGCFLSKLSPLLSYEKFALDPINSTPVLHRSSEYHSTVETAMSPTIPLPVYIRTRSSEVIDSYGRSRRCRRSRTVFSELQLMGLERKFETHKYLSTPDRVDLAKTLGLSQIQVKTWYQNRRMKWKKQVLQRGAKEAPTKPKGRPKKSSYENQPTSVDC